MPALSCTYCSCTTASGKLNWCYESMRLCLTVLCCPPRHKTKMIVPDLPHARGVDSPASGEGYLGRRWTSGGEKPRSSRSQGLKGSIQRPCQYEEIIPVQDAAWAVTSPARHEGYLRLFLPSQTERLPWESLVLLDAKKNAKTETAAIQWFSSWQLMKSECGLIALMEDCQSIHFKINLSHSHQTALASLPQPRRSPPCISLWRSWGQMLRESCRPQKNFPGILVHCPQRD